MIPPTRARPRGRVPGRGGRCARPEGCGAPGAPVRSVHACPGPEPTNEEAPLGTLWTPPRYSRVTGRSRLSTPRRGKPLTRPWSCLLIPQQSSCRPPCPTEGADLNIQATTRGRFPETAPPGAPGTGPRHDLAGTSRWELRQPPGVLGTLQPRLLPCVAAWADPTPGAGTVRGRRLRR